MTIAVGDELPKNIRFFHVPYDREAEGAGSCGGPMPLDFDKTYGNKKVVIVGLPGAFTPTCSSNHVPLYLEKLKELRSKGVDDVIILSYNDAFTMQAWGRTFNANDKLLFAHDPNLEFGKKTGLVIDLSKVGFGDRLNRFAMIVDKGKVTYLGIEKEVNDHDLSSADAVLKNL